MSLRWLLHALKARHWIKALFSSSQRSTWDELYWSNWKLFFFTSFFLVISLKDNVSKCPCVLSSLFLNATGLPLIFAVFDICRTLQTVGPSHARTYTVAVYFKGERIGCGKGPRWVRLHNPIRHNRTRRVANGLQNNGCALLMMFIIAIKLLLAHSIGRDIMQNEKWIDPLLIWRKLCYGNITLCRREESASGRRKPPQLHSPGALCWQRDRDPVCAVCVFAHPLCARSHVLAFL